MLCLKIDFFANDSSFRGPSWPSHHLAKEVLKMFTYGSWRALSADFEELTVFLCINRE